MSNSENKKQGNITSGMKWSVLERIVSQVVASVVSIILARILDPEHYGVVAIVSIFTTLCTTFVTNGLSTALVSKKDSDELDFNSAFIANVVISVCLYIILFLIAPVIATLYEASELKVLIRVMGLMLPFSAISSVQYSYTQKHFQFRTYFWSTFTSTILAGVLGIVLALTGAGEWALVAYHMGKIIVDAIVLLLVCEWKPKLRFSSARIRQMFPFGIKILITAVIMNVESDIRGLIIGKRFSKTDLAYYNNGMQYPKLIYMVLGNSISRVMLPAFSSVQDDLSKIKSLISRSFRLGAYIVTPVMVGFCAVASNFVLTVFTDKWIQSVPFIQIFCITYMFTPFENCCKECILSRGKSGWILIDACLTKGTLFAGVVISAFVLNSVTMIAVSGIVASVLSLILYSIQMKKIASYSIIEIIKDLVPSYFISTVMGVCVYCIGLLPISISALLLGLQIIGGIAVYFGLSVVIKPYGFSYLWNEVIKRIKH